MVANEELAPRLPSLHGKTIAFLWDYVFRGDEVCAVIEAELSQRVSGLTFVHYDALGSTFGGDEHRTVAALADNLRSHHVDRVISAMGG
jgi:hypothetical protein